MSNLIDRLRGLSKYEHSDASIGDEAADRIADLEACVTELLGLSGDDKKRIAELEAEIHNWKTWGVIEVAIRNPSVSEWMKHWEGRCLKAEQEVARLSAHIQAIAKCHDLLIGTTQVQPEYHRERRDFALSIFTKGETT
jgi:hypothetical protein